MQIAPRTKADWLAELERVRLLREELLAEVDDAWLDVPGAAGDWTLLHPAASPGWTAIR